MQHRGQGNVNISCNNNNNNSINKLFLSMENVKKISVFYLLLSDILWNVNKIKIETRNLSFISKHCIVLLSIYVLILHNNNYYNNCSNYIELFDPVLNFRIRKCKYVHTYICVYIHTYIQLLRGMYTSSNDVSKACCVTISLTNCMWHSQRCMYVCMHACMIRLVSMLLLLCLHRFTESG